LINVNSKPLQVSTKDWSHLAKTNLDLDGDGNVDSWDYFLWCALLVSTVLVILLGKMLIESQKSERTVWERMQSLQNRSAAEKETLKAEKTRLETEKAEVAEEAARAAAVAKEEHELEMARVESISTEQTQEAARRVAEMERVFEEEKKKLLLANHEARRAADDALGLKPEGELANFEKTCLICFCDEDESLGLTCQAPEKHFACAECVALHVKAQSGAESRRLLAERGGVRCWGVDPQCEMILSDRSLAYSLADEQFKEYCFAKELIAEARITAEADIRVEREVERELAARLNDKEAANKYRRHIVENIITLKCPGCQQAFFDFTGCAALTCSRAGCGTGFCAVCLKHCGKDAHQHVRAECKLNPKKDYYINLADLKIIHLGEMKRKLKLYLDSLQNEEAVNTAVQAAERELSDVGIDPKDYKVEKKAGEKKAAAEEKVAGERVGKKVVDLGKSMLADWWKKKK
jgi:hypothetical protein